MYTQLIGDLMTVVQEVVNNDLSPILSVPPEIRSMIFGLILPSRPRIHLRTNTRRRPYFRELRKLRLVCKLWNEAIWCDPCLWARVCVDDPPPITVLALQNSRSLPLSVDAHQMTRKPKRPAEDYVWPMQRFFQAISGRKVRSLYLNWHRLAQGEDAWIQPIVEYLKQENLDIERLSIRFAPNTPPQLGSLFAGIAPKLHKLVWKARANLDWDNTSLSRLTILKIESAPDTTCPTWPQTYSMLAESPNLRHLDLFAIDFSRNAAKPGSLLAPPTLFTRRRLGGLRRLRLAQMSPADVALILDNFAFPVALTTFIMIGNNGAPRDLSDQYARLLETSIMTWPPPSSIDLRFLSSPQALILNDKYFSLDHRDSGDAIGNNQVGQMTYMAIFQRWSLEFRNLIKFIHLDWERCSNLFYYLPVLGVVAPQLTDLEIEADQQGAFIRLALSAAPPTSLPYLTTLHVKIRSIAFMFSTFEDLLDVVRVRHLRRVHLNGEHYVGEQLDEVLGVARRRLFATGIVETVDEKWPQEQGIDEEDTAYADDSFTTQDSGDSA